MNNCFSENMCNLVFRCARSSAGEPQRTLHNSHTSVCGSVDLKERGKKIEERKEEGGERERRKEGGNEEKRGDEKKRREETWKRGKRGKKINTYSHVLLILEKQEKQGAN